jgi:hypothetical protein
MSFNAGGSGPFCGYRQPTAARAPLRDAPAAAVAADSFPRGHAPGIPAPRVTAAARRLTVCTYPPFSGGKYTRSRDHGRTRRGFRRVWRSSLYLINVPDANVDSYGLPAPAVIVRANYAFAITGHAGHPVVAVAAVLTGLVAVPPVG